MSILASKSELPDAFHDTTATLLRPAQMAEYEQDIKSAEAQLQNPTVQDKGAVRARLNTLKKQFETQAPREVDGETKDALHAESKRLLDDILPGMLSQEEMRKNPAGSVDKHIRWERANKQKILRWKKIQLMLNADSSKPHTWDRDAANLERYRPVGAQDRFRGDAQISGVMSYGNVDQARWEAAFGDKGPDSALKQAQRVSQTSPEIVPSDGKLTESVQRKGK